MKRSKVLIFCLAVLLSGCSIVSPSVDDKIRRAIHALDRQSEYTMEVEWIRNLQIDWTDGFDQETISVWKEGDAVYETHALYYEKKLEHVTLFRTTEKQTSMIEIVPLENTMAVRSKETTDPLKQPFLHPLFELLEFPLEADETGEIMIPSMFKRSDYNTEFRLKLQELTPFAWQHTDDFRHHYGIGQKRDLSWEPTHMIYEFVTKNGRFVQIDIDEESIGYLDRSYFTVSGQGTVTFPSFVLSVSEKEQVEKMFE